MPANRSWKREFDAVIERKILGNQTEIYPCHGQEAAYALNSAGNQIADYMSDLSAGIIALQAARDKDLIVAWTLAGGLLGCSCVMFLPNGSMIKAIEPTPANAMGWALLAVAARIR